MRLILMALTVLASVQTSAQTPPAFEVASVKPSQPDRPGSASLDAAHFICTGMTLRSLIWSVYRMPPWRVSGGPSWLDTEGWDVSATLPPGMPANRAELMPKADLMVQTLLADRFKLSVHREIKDQPVYELVVAKGGSKLRPASDEKFIPKVGRGRLELRHVSMAMFVSYLYYPPPHQQPGMADRPVLDKTGLDGFFDITLDWAEAGPSLFTALEEQLGLKLEPRKTPIEFLVIDNVEKPAAN